MAGTLKVNGKEYELAGHEYLGVVETINIGVPGDPDSGTATVVIDDIARKARVQYTARNAKPGDTVVVSKTGGIYRVKLKANYEPPPQVSGSMGNPPANAGTVSGGTLPVSPISPSMPPSDSNAHLYQKARDIVAHLDRLENWDNDLRARVNAIQSALNTNASRLNSTRDYASNAGDLVEPVVGVLKNEGMASD